MSIQLIQDFERKFKSKNSLSFSVGDTVRVHTKIIEGEKERIQVFTGIVIAIKGKGLSQTFSVYRNAYGCSMERVFLLQSPRIAKIEVERKGKVRRSKLYHLRGESGKKAKVKEQILKKQVQAESTEELVLKETVMNEEIVEEVPVEKIPEDKPKVEEKPKVEKAKKEPKAKKETKKEAKKKETKPKKKASSKKSKEEKPKEE